MKQRWDVEVAGLESDVGLELEVLKELCRDESAPN